MMLSPLSAEEIRVLGCLMEKAVLTPDQYPMTLNALTNACNQKTSREPVMSLDPGQVEAALNSLITQHLVRKDENFKRGVDKYAQRFCNSTFGEVQIEPDEYAVVTLLLLRGPQTPGELRTRSGRMHTFSANNDVVVTAERLVNRDTDPLLVKLPRTPGRRDAEYMHLLGGPIDVKAYVSAAAEAKPVATSRSTELERRVSTLELEVARLRELIEGS